MDKETTIAAVKLALGIQDSSRDQLISDIYTNAITYMNLDELPDALEPFVRAKVKRVMDYEAQVGEGLAVDVTAQTEGKCSWTFATDENNCRDAIYGFGASDFSQLRRFRKTRK